MIIDNDILARTCKDMIETILYCLSDSTKGTIYRVGPMPKLQVVRITSGVRQEGEEAIQWGLPEVSDYNYPGKTWEQYRDMPGHVKEAMAWCVEKQKSWTADNPYEDLRSVRKQLSGEAEDYHHMEPVLVKKTDLYGGKFGDLDYPLTYEGQPIWVDLDYVVVAVIKIHFKSNRIRRGDPSTKIIKKLSRTLGTQLLSHHIRETLSEAQKTLDKQRLQSCNVLAHELRNTLIKLGFIFSAVNTELGYLREQWELELRKAFPGLESKKEILDRLSQILIEGLPKLNGSGKHLHLCKDLLLAQKDFSNLSLLPQAGEKWIGNRIVPKWRRLLSEVTVWNERGGEIERLLSSLERAIWIGMDENLARKMGQLPEELKEKWPRLAYTDFNVEKAEILNEILDFLDHPQLEIPHKYQTKKILTSLKALVEMIPEVEERANRIICSLKNGVEVEEV
ncbi:MAG: hypothetical protein GX443_05870 [Deltaproteobacteria bacterium]|nr:hypothetical protein [Deltaproteobacteria bacterium]